MHYFLKTKKYIYKKRTRRGSCGPSKPSPTLSSKIDMLPAPTQNSATMVVRKKGSFVFSPKIPFSANF